MKRFLSWMNNICPLKSAARERLGSLFNDNDYPMTLSGLFEVTWDFPSVEPPDYLRQPQPGIV